MIILVRGFIQYSRYIVTITSPDIYVPALHSNQSSLEDFSRIRFMGKDQTDQYTAGVLQQDIINQSRANIKHVGNSSYPNNTIADDTTLVPNHLFQHKEGNRSLRQ